MSCWASVWIFDRVFYPSHHNEFSLHSAYLGRFGYIPIGIKVIIYCAQWKVKVYRIREWFLFYPGRNFEKILSFQLHWLISTEVLSQLTLTDEGL
ncbi:hypothetical protein C9I89_04845 [Photobacterium lipolyticum]|uniref:Uncharacterized protein n=1 Tax=Photobacterium lipolyticum TaxID=266810 RepID=A0A2T3N398_9GAMM|nr:hypothetical protein C9I89_04845 [Photobacterium lipolyticum]